MSITECGTQQTTPAVTTFAQREKRLHCAADDPNTAQHGTYIRKERISSVVECELEKLEHETKMKKKKKAWASANPSKGNPNILGLLCCQSCFTLTLRVQFLNYIHHQSNKLYILVSIGDEMYKLQPNLEAQLIKI